IHELRELAGAEKLPDSSGHGLRINQVARHRGLHFLVNRHLFLDSSLHALETDAELVLEQLAHGAHAAITEVIDVVRLELRRVLAHLEDVSNDLEEIM